MADILYCGYDPRGGCGDRAKSTYVCEHLEVEGGLVGAMVEGGLVLGPQIVLGRLVERGREEAHPAVRKRVEHPGSTRSAKPA